jgi:replicative DNA helicase
LAVELSLIKFAMNKANYLKLSTHINKFELDDEFKLLLNLVSDFYAKYTNLDCVTIEELRLFFESVYPKIKNRDTYIQLFERLSQLEVNPDLLKDIVNQFHEKMIANEVINKLSPVLYESQFGVLPTIQEDLDRFKGLAGLEFDAKKVFVSQDLGELMERQVYSEGLKWRLDCLNNDLGPLRGKTLGHIFASVDTGKTSFLASEATWFARQLKDDETIIWFNNEEDGSKVQLRLYCAALDRTKEQLAGQETRAIEVFKQKGGDKIKIVDRALITVEDMIAVLKSTNAKMVIVDQGDKVAFRGSGQLSTVDRLKALYGKFREISKDFDLALLTAGQASSAAEGEKWLNRTHMDNSKVGKPGELDYAIAIGKSQDEHEEAFRYISICKNKLHNGAHGKHTVRIDTSKALYSNLTGGN